MSENPEVMPAEDLPRPKKRSGLAAAVLTLCTPGFGHIYAGQPKAAAIVVLVQVVLVLAFGFFLGKWVAGLVIFMVLAVGFQITTVVHAAVSARRAPVGPLPRLHRWYVFLPLAIALPFLTTAVLQKAVIPFFRFRAYRLPASSMEPTMRVGDKFIVDTWAFRQRDPERGEITSFRFPDEPSRIFLKRCVAVGGDEVRIVNRRVFVNGKKLEEPYVWFADTETASRVPASTPNLDDFGPRTIADGAFFMLGDNRDRSWDSRFWGDVPREFLQAAPLYYYWSNDLKRVGKRIQ